MVTETRLCEFGKPVSLGEPCSYCGATESEDCRGALMDLTNEEIDHEEQTETHPI